MSKMEKINFVAGLAVGIVLTSIVNCSTGNKKVDNAESTTSPCVETTVSPYAETTALENAIESAEEYNKVLTYSKKGIIEILKYEGFSEDIAECAVKSINANWKENCVKSAYSYLDLFSFSKKELIHQLDYDGFTPEEIDYAMNQIYK